MADYPWTSLSGSDAPDTSHTWRGISITSCNTSSAAELRSIDENVPITVAKNSTTLVFIQYTKNGEEYDKNVSVGIYPSSTGISSDCSGFVGIGSDNSNKYVISGGDTTVAAIDPYTKYGGIEVYAIHNFDTSQDITFWMAGSGYFRNVYYDVNKFFKASYFLEENDGASSWKDIEKYGCRFAFIARKYTTSTEQIQGENVTVTVNEWIKYNYTFYTGYTYTIILDVNCSDTNHAGYYEGIAFFSYDKEEPNVGTKTSEISGLEHDADDNPIFVDGDNRHKEFVYNPTSDTTGYFYFRKNKFGVGGIHFGHIKIIRHINVNIGSNGGSTQTLKLKPYTAEYSNIIPGISAPTRMGSNSIPYTFISDGFFTSTLGSDMILKLSVNTHTSTSGYYINNFDKTIVTSSADLYWYAHWGNTISYNLTSSSPIYMWATLGATEASETKESTYVIIASEGVKCASSGTVSTSFSSSSGFTIDSTAQYLYAPDGKATGVSYSHNDRIHFTSPSKTTYPTCEGMTMNTNIVPPVYVSAVMVSEYGTPNPPSISQTNIIPAYGVTLNSTNLSNYFSWGGSVQYINYNNGRTRSGDITYTKGGTGKIPSLGISYKSTNTSADINGSVKPYVQANGEGGMSNTSQITKANQEPNVVTNVYTYLVNNPSSSTSTSGSFHVSYGSMFGLCMVARYTSGEERDIFGDGVEDSVSFSLSLPSHLEYVKVSDQFVDVSGQ